MMVLKGLWFEGLMVICRKIFWKEEDITARCIKERLSGLVENREKWIKEEVKVFFQYKPSFLKKNDISINVESKKWVKKRKGQPESEWYAFEDADEIHLSKFLLYKKYEESLKNSLEIMGIIND